jgi:DNA modification methylase
MKITADKSYERVARETLTPFQGQLKELRVEEYNQLKDSMEREGFFEPVEYWQDKEGQRWIIDGHQRLFVCDKEGWPMPEVPVRPMAAKNKEEAARKLLLLNSRYGRMTGQGLYEYMHEFSIEADELDRFSFSDLDLDSFKLEFFEDTTLPPGDEDAVPEVQAEAITKPGDLWLLDEHRVLCGDATSATDIERVLGGAKPNLMVTDPPYGVEYDANWRNEAADKGLIAHAAIRVGAVENDERIDWTEAWALFEGDVAYVWHAAWHASEVQATLMDAEIEIRSQIIWAKSRFAISRGHYHWQHEPCWYGVRKGGKGHWIGDRSQTTLWEINLDANVDGGHSTQKPLECMERPMRNHSGDVYDPFLGSGTTLIAAEKTGRTCYGTEISPNYVDVIVKRWQNYTGKDATLDGDGRTFNEVAQGEHKQEPIAAG